MSLSAKTKLLDALEKSRVQLGQNLPQAAQTLKWSLYNPRGGQNINDIHENNVELAIRNAQEVVEAITQLHADDIRIDPKTSLSQQGQQSGNQVLYEIFDFLNDIEALIQFRPSRDFNQKVVKNGINIFGINRRENKGVDDFLKKIDGSVFKTLTDSLRKQLFGDHTENKKNLSRIKEGFTKVRDSAFEALGKVLKKAIGRSKKKKDFLQKALSLSSQEFHGRKKTVNTGSYFKHLGRSKKLADLNLAA